MIQILAGPDDFSIRESLIELKKGLGDESLLSMNTVRLEGQSLTIAELRTVCQTVPFMSEKRLVIVTGLLGRFEPKSKTARPARAERPATTEVDCRPWGAAINQVPDSTVLVLIDDKVSSGNPLFQLVSARAGIKNFPSLIRGKLEDWIRKQVKTEGGAISPAATKLLVQIIGSDLWTMANEVSKLALLTSGRQIEETDVRAAVGYARETTVFALVDAIMESRAGVAGQLLEQLKRDGATPSYILTMIARQSRLIVLVREMRNSGCRSSDIQNRLGVREFAVQKTLDLAGRYSLARVKEVYRKLLEADVAAKTGQYDGDLALNILVAELCQAG